MLDIHNNIHMISTPALSLSEWETVKALGPDGME